MNRKCALITGASKGIGYSICFELAAKGWNLIIVARTESKLSDLKNQLESVFDINVYCIVLDLRLATERKSLLIRLKELQISLSALINNAGYGSSGLFHHQDNEWELGQIRLNVEALVDLTHKCLPELIDNQGYVLNIASTAGFQPGPYMSVYYASKAFVLHFSEALDMELKETGVSVTAHCPGATISEFSKVSGNEKSMLFSKYNLIMTSERVAKHAVQSMFQRKRVAIPGLHNKLTVLMVRLLPRRLVVWGASWINRPRKYLGPLT